jgi:hypothetical protein
MTEKYTDLDPDPQHCFLCKNFVIVTSDQDPDPHCLTLWIRIRIWIRLRSKAVSGSRFLCGRCGLFKNKSIPLFSGTLLGETMLTPPHTALSPRPR